MNRTKLLTSVILAVVMVVSLCFATVAFADGTIATSTIEAWKFGGGWGTTTDYVPDGVRITVPGSSTVIDGNAVGGEAWTYKATINNHESVAKAFSLKNNEKVVVEFSAKLFDKDGNQISKSNNSDALDVYIKQGDTQLALLRIWTNSGSATNGSHSYHLYAGDWANKATDSWIVGDATAESKFTLQIDKTNIVSSFVGGQANIVPLGTAEYIAERQKAFASVDEFQIVIQGENGFTDSTEIVLRSVNGQSLANVDGMFTDTVSPVFIPSTVTATVNAGEAYTIPTEAYDLLGEVTYKVKVGDAQPIDGKTFVPTGEGKQTITLIATDAAGNSSQVSYEIEVVNNIAAPIITSLPEIRGGEVKYFDTLVFDKPQFEDVTGAATTVLKIYLDTESDPIATLQENSNHQFEYFVGVDFAAATYSFVYEVTNSAGTTVSDPVSVEYTNEKLSIADFVDVSDGGNMIADYVEAGIRLRSREAFKRFMVGEFDLAEGIDVKFIAQADTVDGKTNTTDYVNFILVNKQNKDMQLMYRVWCGHSGSDRPTNVYISTDCGVTYTDITDTGWISRTVGNVEDQYHMAFDMEETFKAERIAGIQRIDNTKEDVYKLLADFLAACPSSDFLVGFEASRLGTPTGDYELIISEINGQKFAAPLTKNDAFLSVQSDIPEKVGKDEQLTIKAYAKDIFAATKLELSVVKPDGSAEEVGFEGRNVAYTFDQLGTYTLTIGATGSNGNFVKKQYTVVCKSSTQEIEIGLDGEYKATYEQGSSVKIISATISENVVSTTITVKYPDGTAKTVTAGDDLILTAPGIYTITYTAQDASEPTPNKKELVKTINVPDTKKPVVTVEVATSAKVGDKIEANVTYTDDSDCDVTVTLVKPDNTSVKMSLKDGKCILDLASEGKYTLKVAVEDIYGNKETVNKDITVTTEKKPEKKGCFGVVGVASATFTAAVAALAVVLVRKKNDK